jgi:UDP-N-acetylmuramate dehydrogenase
MQILQNISLKPFNTFGVDVHATRFAQFDSPEMLKQLLDDKIAGRSPLFVLGGGSNVLFTKDVNALVLKNEIKGIIAVHEDEHYIYVKAGAGENWHDFVQYCLLHQYAGVENLALIPGNVGASPMQNIGAYGVELRDVFYNLEAFSIKDKKVFTFSLNDCRFDYRESIFKKELKNQFIILSVTYRLRKKPVFHTSYGAIQQELEKMGVKELSIQAIAKAVINIRSSKLPDPAVVGNAGSFFKNPSVSNNKHEELQKKFPGIVSYKNEDESYKLAAGWLIEQCGWKGFRKGDAGCHPKQALVLVNYGNASGKQVYDLSTEILKTVKSKFGITLEREVNVY